MYSKRKTKPQALIILLIAVLCSCLILTTYAWLIKNYSYLDDSNNIGKIDVQIYANNVKVIGTTTTTGGVTKWNCDIPYEINGGNTVRTLNLKIRNEGTIDALVRAIVSVYYMEGTNKRVALIVSANPTADGTIKLDQSGWVLGFPESSVACGYMFYNSKLEPYTKKSLNGENITTATNSKGETSIINQIMTSTNQKSTKFYVDLTVDAVAYGGNIYKKIENNETTTADIPVTAYPFGVKESLPSTWTAWK